MTHVFLSASESFRFRFLTEVLVQALSGVTESLAHRGFILELYECV